MDIVYDVIDSGSPFSDSFLGSRGTDGFILIRIRLNRTKGHLLRQHITFHMEEYFMVKVLVTMTAAAAILSPSVVFADDDYLNPYAQARVYSGYVDQSKKSNAASAAVDGKNDTEVIMKNVNARLGVKGKKGTLEGVAEIGLGKDAGTTAATTRHIYGIWNFMDNMSLLFGQTEAPYAFYSNCATDGNLNMGYGTTHQDRDLQMKLTVFGGYIDILNPTVTPAGTGSTFPNYTVITQSTIVDPASPVTAPTFTTVSVKTNYAVSPSNITVLVPKIALGYDFKMKDDTMDILIGGGVAGQSLKIDKKNSTSAVNAEVILNDKTINSYLAYVHAKVKVGAFSLLSNFGYGQNTANMGLRYDQGYTAAASSLKSSLCGGYIAPAAELDTTSMKIKNARSMEGYIDAGYDIGICDLRAGWGFALAKSGLSGSKYDAQYQYFLHSSFPAIAKKLWIKPELCYRDFAKDRTGAKQGYEWLAGIYIQANIE